MKQPSASEHSAIEKILKRNSLLACSAQLPAPIQALFCESEQVDNFFFEVASGNVILAKVPRAESRVSELWQQVDHFRAQKVHPALLPLTDNQQRDRILVYADGTWVRKTLKRLKLIKARDVLRTPTRIVSGLAGFSRLYIFYIPARPPRFSGTTVLVKFDRPDRMRKEWEAVDAQRAAGDVPAEIILPLPRNTEKDGIMLTAAFQSMTTSGQVQQLNEFVRWQLLSNFNNLSTLLVLLKKFLKKLYLDGATKYEAFTWRDFNRELVAQFNELPGFLQKQKIPLSLDQKSWTPPELAGKSATLQNPLSNIEHQLQQETGRLLKARTHGDLQSTNVLIALSENQIPENIGIIDIEKLNYDQPVLEDLVRIEADFWRSVFTEIARDQFSAEQVASHAMEAMILALDTLDGRKPRVQKQSQAVLELCNAAGRFVFAIRTMTWQLLRTPGENDYYPISYMVALRFYYLKSILRPLVHEDALRARIVLLGAALATETWSDMIAGRYPVQRTLLKQWNDLCYPIAEPSLPSDGRPPRVTAEQLHSDSCALPKTGNCEQAAVKDSRAMRAPLEPGAIEKLVKWADGNQDLDVRNGPEVSGPPPAMRHHIQESATEKQSKAIPSLKGALPKISSVHYLDQYTLLDERGLFGRAVELANLTQWLQGRQFNNTRILSLTELGGAGKTALAWYWLTNRVDDGGLLGEAGFDGALWLSFYSDPSWGFEKLWREILVRFGETDRKVVDAMDSADVARTVVEVLHKRRLLLVLDGVERAMVEYLRHRKLGLEEPSTFSGARKAALSKGALVDRRAGEVFRRFAAHHADKIGSRILLTSRLGLRDLETSSKSDRECEGTTRIILEPMQMPESLEFWTWCSGEPPDNEVLLPLLSAVGCHAIVIRVLALAVKTLGGWKHWVAKQPDYLPWSTTNLFGEAANYWKSLLAQDLSLVPQYQHLLTHWGFSSPLVRMFVSELRHAGGAEAWAKSHANLANDLGGQDGALRLARALVLSSALEDLRGNIAAWTVLQILCSPSAPTRRQDLEQTFLAEIDNAEDRENAAAALDLLIQRGVIGSARQRNQDGTIGEFIYDVHPVIRTHVWDGQFASRVRYLDALSRAQSATPGASPRLENLDQVNGDIVRYGQLIDRFKDYPKAWDLLNQKLSPKLREAKAMPGVAAKLVKLYEKLCSVTGGIGIPLLPQRQHQAEVLSTLSNLYHEAGRVPDGDRANRLAATLFLLAGDTERYLLTLQNRNWSPIYSGDLVEARASLVSLWKLRPFGYRGLAVAAWLALVDAIRGQGQTLDHLVVGLKRQLGSQNRWILQTLAEAFVYLGRYQEAIELLDVIAQFDVDKVFAPAERGQLMWERLTRGMALVDANERLNDEQANAALAVLDEAYELASNLDSYLFGQALTLAYRAKAFSKALYLDDAERQIEQFDGIENAHFYQIPHVEARIAQARVLIGQGKNGDAVQALQEAFNRAVTTRTTQHGVSFGYAKGEREILHLLSQIQGPMFLRKRVAIIHSEAQISDSLLASFEKPENWEDKREKFPADRVTPEGDDFETFELGQSSDPAVTSENQYSGLPPWWQVYSESRWPDWLSVVFAFLQREQASRDEYPQVFDSTATPDISVIVRRSKRHHSAGGNPILNLNNHIKSELVRWAEIRKPERTPYQEIKSEADFDPFLRFARARLKYDTAKAEARLWWDEMEMHCRNDPSALLEIADELIAMEATIDEFYIQLCGAPSADTLAVAISAMLAVRLDESILTRKISETPGWADDRLLRRSERLKDRLLLHKCEAKCRQWYFDFDIANNCRLYLVVRFYEELWSMQANLQQFFAAYINSETDDVQANLDWLTCTWLNVAADATGTSMIPRVPDQAAGRFSSVTEASKYLDEWWSALRAAAPKRMWFTAKGRDSQLALVRTSLCVATPPAWRLPGSASPIAKAEDLTLFENGVGLDAERALILYEHLKEKGFTASEWLWAVDHHKAARSRMKLPDFGEKNQVLLLPAVVLFLNYSVLSEKRRRKTRRC